MTICYRCDINLAVKTPVPEKFRDEEGNRPCMDCLFELEDEADVDADVDLDHHG